MSALSLSLNRLDKCWHQTITMEATCHHPLLTSHFLALLMILFPSPFFVRMIKEKRISLLCVGTGARAKGLEERERRIERWLPKEVPMHHFREKGAKDENCHPCLLCVRFSAGGRIQEAALAKWYRKGNLLLLQLGVNNVRFLCKT